MSRYFARLVERASGAAPKVPPVGPVPPIPAVPQQPDLLGAATPPEFDHPMAQPAPMLPLARPTIPAAPPLPANPIASIRPQEILEKPESRAPSDEPVAPEAPKLKPPPTPLPAPVSAQKPSPPETVERPPLVESTRMEAKQVSYSVPPPRPAAPLDTSAHAVAQKPVPQPLAPPPLPAPSQTPPAEEPSPEPRLVIGRINVEVVPVAPVRPQPTAVARPRGPTSRAFSVPAHFHFGLGQM